jgi:hypothetical protein
VVERKPELILRPLLDDLASAFSNVILYRQRSLWQQRYGSLTVEIFLKYETLVFNDVCVQVVVVKASVILQVKRVPFNIDVFDQIRKLAFLEHILRFFVFNRDLAVVLKVFVLFLFPRFFRIFKVVHLTVTSEFLG